MENFHVSSTEFHMLLSGNRDFVWAVHNCTGPFTIHPVHSHTLAQLRLRVGQPRQTANTIQTMSSCEYLHTKPLSRSNKYAPHIRHDGMMQSGVDFIHHDVPVSGAADSER